MTDGGPAAAGADAELEVRERIRTVFERSVKTLERRPAMGQGTAVTRVRVGEGMHCRIEDGAWSLEADLPEKAGGRGAAPDPGVLGRSALGSCLAMAYVSWAAWLGVPIDSLQIDVEADYDARGQYGIGEVDAGYQQVRCRIRILSDATDDTLRELSEEVHAHCPYLDVFRRAQDVRCEVEVASPSGKERP